MAPPIEHLGQVVTGSPAAPGIRIPATKLALSRGQLSAAIDDLAARLSAAGIAPGSAVALALPNTVEFIVSFLAVCRARLVAAPLNPAYKPDEFKFYLEDSKSVLLLTDANEAALAAAATLRIPTATVALRPGGTGPPTVQVEFTSAGRLQLPAPGSAPALGPPRPSDVALFLHTSGTTGRPKGVPLTHANLAASIRNIINTYELTSADVSYLVMPLFHVHGLMAGLLAPLAAGSTVALPAGGKFSAHSFWKDCVACGATFYTAVPTIHQVLLARASQDYPAASPPPLRFIRSCSSALAPATMEALEAAFHAPVLEAYAMTEASHQMCSSPLPKHGPRKPGTVGRAQGGVRVAILGSDNKVLPSGQIGEVCIQGDNVTAGYLNNPAANQEAFAGGWFHTGDQGVLDGDGYLTLTGRIKELINRGGEKISPLEVDACLLSHPAVAEAVCFAAPDAKYGEVVAAVVVLKPGVQKEGADKAIQAHCASKLAAFKVPTRVFITDAVPKTATGKIQRRHMVAAFIGAPKPSAAHAPPAQTPAPAVCAGIGDGHELVARALAALGVKHAYGVVGIPVTPLGSSLMAAGVRFIGMRNEQAAGYAAAASGYLTGTPAVLLTVSGPGAVHGIAGASHATANCWPLIMLSGSSEQADLGKGAFQELDQVAALAPHCKLAVHPRTVLDLPALLRRAFEAAVSGRPGAAYVDLPSNFLLTRLDVRMDAALAQLKSSPTRSPLGAGSTSLDPGALARAIELLRGASRPLLVAGKGAALARAEGGVQRLANRFGIPVLCTAMGRGLLPDGHALCVNAARGAALRGADVALVVGARLNWQLHFGETPRWSAGIKFVLLDVEPSAHDVQKAAAVLRGDAAAGLDVLHTALAAQAWDATRIVPWAQELVDASRRAAVKLEGRIAAARQSPLDYHGALGELRARIAALHPAPIVVSEGANTMDMARVILPAAAPRCRLDAGTWGTMGVGPGYAIGAATSGLAPGQVVIAVEGDSAFGFSGMEVEVMARYKLPIVVVVMNNGGIYGGDRRDAVLAAAAAAGLPNDPPPTSFVPHSRHDLIMRAFGGEGVRADNRAALGKALDAAIERAAAGHGPTLLDVVLDPMAGVESGNVHAFNAPRSEHASATSRL